MMKALALLSLGLLLTAADAVPFVYYRAYQPGDQFRYELDVTQDIDGRFDTEEKTATRHRVFGGQQMGEDVTFENLIFRDHEGNKDLSALAQKVPPIRFSLDVSWRNQIPEINVIPMRGVVTDMYLFFSALGAGSGVRRLKDVGDVVDNPEWKRNVWSSDRFVPVGEDCTVMRLTLLAADRESAKIRSEFRPPQDPCLQMQRSWMNEYVVKGTPNNFQSVRHDDDGYTLIWGHESIVIESETETQTGVIRRATLENTLNLKMRRGCNAEYENCQPETAFVIHRRGTLQRR